jgi:hypothetical protein
MTPEEKRAALEFIGNIYGASSKLDSGIIGQSNFLKPMSLEIKQQFEQVLRSPVVPQHEAQPDVPHQVHVTPTSVEPQPVALVPQVVTPTAPPITPNKLSGDIMERIALSLEKIAAILENKNAKPARKTKNIVKSELH